MNMFDMLEIFKWMQDFGQGIKKFKWMGGDDDDVLFQCFDVGGECSNLDICWWFGGDGNICLQEFV